MLQDGLAGDELVPGLLIAVVIDILGFSLEVEVTADAAQGEAVAAAADPVSLLHIGEREGIAGVLRIRDKETGKGRIRFISFSGFLVSPAVSGPRSWANFSAMAWTVGRAETS